MNLDESYNKFLTLLDRPKIKDFLKEDQCNVLADKYLLAAVFLIFRKAKLLRREYNYKNFFISLFLMHEIQEDFHDFKDDIIRSYYSPKYASARKCTIFLNDRFLFFEKINYDANVTKNMCMKIINRSDHWAWKRKRKKNHSGVLYYTNRRCRKCRNK